LIIQSAKNGHKPIQFTIRIKTWEFIIELKDIIRIAPIAFAAWAYAVYWLVPNREDLDYLLKSDSVKTVMLNSITERLDNADKLVEKQRLLDSILNAEYNIDYKEEDKIYEKNKIKKYSRYDFDNYIDDRILELERSRQRRKDH
jgi:hypothetical protein